MAVEGSMPDAASIRRFLEIQDTQITKAIIFEFFSPRPKMKDGKMVSVLPPLLYPDDSVVLPAGSLPNITEKVTTTVGRYFFNMFCIATCFGDAIPYINKTIAKRGVDDLQQIIVDKLLDGHITTDQFAKFQSRLIWLNNFTEIFVPGMTIRLITPLPEVQKRKAELIAQYADDIEKGDFVKVSALIEKELLKIAEETLKNDPGWPLYALGSKPSFGNNYKNTQIMMGPIKDPITGQYKISTRSLAEGIPKKQFAVYANTLIMGSYSRGVATQDGGAKTKFLFAAMQSEILDEPGSDCGTELLETFKITDKNKKTFLYRYVKTKGGFILLDRGNIAEFVDQEVQMRSPLFCASPKLCSKCVGELYYKIGIRNLGLTVTKITSTLLNLSLKSMHDATVDTIEINPFDYMKLVS